jgi:hypothetical protein
MGLDMYVFMSTKKEVKVDNNLLIKVFADTNSNEFFYWRKHPAIHSWMENLYYDRGGKGTFNGVPVYLDKDNLRSLKRDIVRGRLNYAAAGFFFGNSSKPDTQEGYIRLRRDLEFVNNALKEIKQNSDTIFVYDSSW